MKRSTPALLATLAFLVCIGLPLILTVASLTSGDPKPGAPTTGAAPPVARLLLEDFPGFTSAFEAWVNESFRPRTEMIRANNLARLALFDETPSKSVRKGQGRWLFYADEWEMEDYENVMPISPEGLAALARNMEDRRAWLAARGIRFYVAIAPNKSDAYREFLPKSIRQLGPRSRLDQVAEVLAANPKLDFLDLREPLRRAKAEHRTYDYTDTHWNAYGAFAGYREIMARVARDFPAVRPLDYADYEVAAENGPGGDLAGQLSLKADLPEERILMNPRFTPRARDAGRDYPDPVAKAGRAMVVKETGDVSLPKALVFRDSFCWQLIPFLAESFQSSVYVWTFDFLPALVEKEKPDVVILQAVERYIMALTLEAPETRGAAEALGTAKPE